MGISNRIHVRKLQLILKSYRLRYQRKRDKIQVDEEDDLLSDYSPSELSAMIAAEDAHDEAGSDEFYSEVAIGKCTLLLFALPAE